MICPHCSKRIDDELIDRYRGFVAGIEASEAASVLGSIKTERKAASSRANIAGAARSKRVPDHVRADILASPASGAELARRHGLSQSTVSKIRSGAR